MVEEEGFEPRDPDEPNGFKTGDHQPVRGFPTFTRDLNALADWLQQYGVRWIKEYDHDRASPRSPKSHSHKVFLAFAGAQKKEAPTV